MAQFLGDSTEMLGMARADPLTPAAAQLRRDVAFFESATELGFRPDAAEAVRRAAESPFEECAFTQSDASGT